MPTSPDTSPEIRAIQVAAFKAMSPMRRIQMAIELSELTRSIHRIGVSGRLNARH